MLKDFEVKQTKLKLEFAKSSSGVNVDVASLREKLNQSLSDVQGRFQRSLDLLIDRYDQYMTNVSPPTFLLPIFITLSVAGRPHLIFDVTVRMTDCICDLRDMLVELSGTSGNPILEFGPLSRLTLRRAHGRKKPSAPNSPKLFDVLFGRKPSQDSQDNQAINSSQPLLIEDETLCIGNLSLEHHSEIMLVGGVRLADELPTCQTGERDIQFFFCLECKEYTICKSCAMHCHKGHTVVLMAKEEVKDNVICHCSEPRAQHQDHSKLKSVCRIRKHIERKEPDPNHKYDDEIRQMVGMGFQNEELNLLHLRAVAGDIDKALNNLLRSQINPQ
jgi:hypothetical protein